MTQEEVVTALMKPEAYDEEPGRIEFMQTHISFLFFTRDYVFKVKKAVDFGFLDFTTLEKRLFFCQKELELNKRLCDDMYLEVAPINKSNLIRIKGEGETIDYAVKMKRIPQEKIMNKLLEENKIDCRVIERIAKIIAKFHSNAVTDERVSEFGSLDVIGGNWKENFEQTQEFIGKTISMKNFDLVREKINEFMQQNVSAFEKRVKQGRIRDCHGDIHSGNIFVADKIYIFDTIEFNERFRYSDVASDIAFLAMDLDFKNRADLSSFLVDRYAEYSRDKGFMELLPFYKCYRAYVRGKVISFKLNDPNVSKQEKVLSRKEAKAYFRLASAYAKSLN